MTLHQMLHQVLIPLTCFLNYPLLMAANTDKVTGLIKQEDVVNTGRCSESLGKCTHWDSGSIYATAATSTNLAQGTGCTK